MFCPAFPKQSQDPLPDLWEWIGIAGKLYVFKIIYVFSNLYTWYGAWTLDPKIKSCKLFWLSQPDAPGSCGVFWQAPQESPMICSVRKLPSLNPLAFQALPSLLFPINWSLHLSHKLAGVSLICYDLNRYPGAQSLGPSAHATWILEWKIELEQIITRQHGPQGGKFWIRGEAGEVCEGLVRALEETLRVLEVIVKLFKSGVTRRLGGSGG